MQCLLERRFAACCDSSHFDSATGVMRNRMIVSVGAGLRAMAARARSQDCN
jgi:hypothetical protein